MTWWSQIVLSRHGKYIGQRELIWKSTQLIYQIWILLIVGTGFRIDFISRLTDRSANPGECSMSQKMEALCDEEVSNLLRKKAISVASSGLRLFRPKLSIRL
jgi:hypothetical protein